MVVFLFSPLLFLHGCFDTMTKIIQVSDSFIRPDNATPYGAADLVANSATAGSVVPLAFHLGAGGSRITQVRLDKTDTDLTGAIFSVYLFGSSPTTAVGDNTAFTTASFTLSDIIDVAVVGQMVSASDNDYAMLNIGDATFLEGVYTSKETIYGLVVTGGTYTPLALETFTVTLTAVKVV